MAKKVFIGVGHGGADNGAVANGLKEDNLNLAIALACRDELIRHGVKVGMSRTKDEADTLADEIKECNAFGPDYAIEIHNNAGGGDGVEIYHHYGGGKGKTLAQNILNEIVAIGQNSRGLKIKKNNQGKDWYGWIRQTSAPACLIECAFVDNKKDITNLLFILIQCSIFGDFGLNKTKLIKILEKGSTKISEYLAVLKQLNLCLDIQSGKNHYFKCNLEELDLYE